MGDVVKMIIVGLVWGATNSLMRRGAIIWDERLRSFPSTPSGSLLLHQRLLGYFHKWLNLLIIWQYSIPFVINLSASATFFSILSHAPISVAVPVSNATTFAATAVTAVLLGEETHLGFTLFGTVLIVLGVWICVS